MAIKAIIMSLATALLAVGCVAFPEDGSYRQGGYQYGAYDRDRGYDHNSDRNRWERERAYRLQQARLEQERQRRYDWERRERQERSERVRRQRADYRIQQLPQHTWDHRQQQKPVIPNRAENNKKDQQWDRREQRRDNDRKRDRREQNNQDRD